jgi:hypothetical protein
MQSPGWAGWRIKLCVGGRGAVLAAFAADALAFWWLSEQGRTPEQDSYDFKL